MTKKIMTSLFLLAAFLFTNASFAQDQKSIDDKLLQDYFKANNIKATKTQSGLYYTIKTPGTGPNAKAGKEVSMNYVGKFLDGRVFDANVDANYKPVNGRTVFSFPLGMHNVITGWDEGIQLFNKGTRATLYIPSALAYGPNGNGPIPPNAVIMFDVEVVSIAQ